MRNTRDIKGNKSKRAVRDAKVSADERWNGKVTGNFLENKMMFWKEVHRIRKETSGNKERMKAENGRILVEKEAVQERWEEYFVGLVNA